jgi:hypothetical protein
MMQFVFAATSNQWIFSLIVPLKFSLSAMEASWRAFLRHERRLRFQI